MKTLPTLDHLSPTKPAKVKPSGICSSTKTLPKATFPEFQTVIKNKVCSPTLTTGVKLTLLTSIPGLVLFKITSVVLFAGLSVVLSDFATTTFVKLPVLLVLNVTIKLAFMPIFKT